ncbi:MAG: hypothetical protein M9928_20640 [Anaerolineae bacterium]|nr:hypothetical protein [Anaerolineae bacterium]
MELSRNVAFIGPQQLQSAFHVILRSALGPSHITSAVTIDALRKALGNIVPDIVLAFVASSADEIGPGRIQARQIASLKQCWPNAQCLAFVESTTMTESVRAFGADAVLLEGVSAGKLVEMLGAFCRDNDAVGQQNMSS